MTFDRQVFLDSVPVLLSGLWETAQLVVASLAASLLLAVFLCLGRLRGRGPVYHLCSAYVALFRGLPEAVLIFWMYFCGPLIFNARYTGFESATIALAAISAAYFAEIFRAGIAAVPRGQFEAGRALGLSDFHLARDVVAPQALRLMVAPLLGYTTILIKNTSIASAIGVEELFYRANVFAGQNLRYLEVFTTAAVFYFLIIAPLSALVQAQDARVRKQLS